MILTVEDPTKLFNAYYYAHGCGELPYQRDPVWLEMFGQIANHIVRDIQPKSVLDAGCALGFLVEELRKKDVEAFGVDVSEFAIENVHTDIKPYCWQGTITDPFPQEYDLIVTIEVLEHMSREQGEKAVANLCSYSDDILFSSSPFDYKEATHFNVQPPEYWVSVFARHGFYRDVDFDASFITPWTIRFRKQVDPLQRIIAAYERKLWLMLQESHGQRDLNHELSTLNQEQSAKNQELSDLNQTQSNQLAAQQRELEDKEALIQMLETELNHYKSLQHRTWFSRIKRRFK